VNTTGQTCWVAISVATGAAVWKQLTNVAAGGFLAHKAGSVLAVTFAGDPKKATVTFGTAFSNANYSVTLSCVTAGNQYAPSVESQIAASFVINMGANSIGSLTQVNWTAVQHGEST
jgi:hypothetical protein